MKLPKPTKLPSNSSRLNLGIKGSSKVLSYINEKSAKRSSAAIQNYHLAGVRGGGEAAYNTRSHTAASELSNPTTCVMTRDASGNYKFKEENERAWGFLIQNKQEPFPLIRHVEYRKTNEPAGYSIGGDPESAIRITHKDAEKDHAFIYGVKSRSEKGIHRVAVYISNRSSNGIWINSKKMQINTVELSAEDEIRFFDPEKYKNTTENPTFTFIRNPNWATTYAASIHDLFLTGKKIGSGSFGQVFSAQCRETNKMVAMKVIYKNAFLHKPKAKESLLREIGVCLSFPVHPCIIQVNRLFDIDNKMYIIMEYGIDGDLFDSITSGEMGMKEYEVKIVFDQIAHAISFLHGRGIVHRDIKLENIIMCDRKSLTVKLCDFGLSTFIRNNKPLETSCGTIMYAAPELLESKGYGKEIDIWSLGVLLFTALATSTPFLQGDDNKEEDRKRLQDQIKSGQLDYSMPVWEEISADAKDLIDNMILVDKKKRFTIQQVIEHKWLKNIESEEALKAGLRRNQALVNYLKHGKV
ncbi:CAMK protein kinase [Mucor circinelloides 1006PhL]|uniref:CAMK protein kinase n=1 Tax=Mucor circinelloides f. circinelloides (strain 1006PhL) TaxID=1220926 RepID=S2J0W4_MUCC1|nr:CAMK protein kinase [Mucor circinelloides 1006PhL]